MKFVQRPAHGLAVGRDDVEGVHLGAVIFVAHGADQAVHGHEIDDATLVLPGAIEAPTNHFVIAGGANPHAENVVTMGTGNGSLL